MDISPAPKYKIPLPGSNGRKESEKEMSRLTLTIENDELYLNGLKLQGIEAYELKKNSGHPKGTAELKVSLIVNYSDNRPRQNL